MSSILKTVLVTGSTGVVGSSLVPLLLEERETEVRLVIRAQSDDHLRERLGQLIDYWEIDKLDPSLRKMRAFRGDVCRPGLGLAEREYDRLAGEVTHIVHAAGNVKLNQTLDQARRSAVGSLEEITRFARACQLLGRFQKLDYVSTVGVAGRMQGLIPERRLTEQRNFHNNYEQAKAESEDYLWAEMDCGLPATIHRPSMVVGDSRTGRILAFQVFYHLCDFLSGRRTHGIIPHLGNAKLDVIPVDYVARAIQVAVDSDEAVGRTFQLCSGPNRAIRLSSLLDQVRGIFDAYVMKSPPLRTLRPSLVRTILPVISLLARRKKWRALRGLPALLSYLRTCQSQSFETTDTVDFLSYHGLTQPPTGQALVGTVLDYYWIVTARQHG